MLIRPVQYVEGVQHIDSFIIQGYSGYDEVAVEGRFRAESVSTRRGDIDANLDSYEYKIRELEDKIKNFENKVLVLSDTVDEFTQNKELIKKYPELAKLHFEFTEILKKYQTVENIIKEHSTND